MLRTRVIPCLQLVGSSLVKAVKFKKYKYIGDPVNTVRIFNELEVDELCFLDIRATKDKRYPDLKILQEISNECFMPVSYGGGIQDLDTTKKILSIGFEKIVLNSAAIEKPSLITDIATLIGSQSVVVSIDVKKSLFKGNKVFTISGTKNTKMNPVEWAQQIEKLGAGEILLTSIDRESTWNGFDVDLVAEISASVSIPIIAHGGAGKVRHVVDVVKSGNASAVALGSMVVYQRKGMGVLVNFPDKTELENALR